MHFSPFGIAPGFTKVANPKLTVTKNVIMLWSTGIAMVYTDIKYRQLKWIKNNVHKRSTAILYTMQKLGNEILLLPMGNRIFCFS